MSSLSSTVRLNSGYMMPLVGLGTWRSKPGEVTAAVKAALLNGYKHIDTAWAYGNEQEVGLGIKQAIDESKDNPIKRDSFFVTTKLWNQFHNAGQVEDALRDSLSKLQLDYVDLYLIHWPVSFKHYPEDIFSTKPDGTTDVIDVPIKETWQAMESLVEKGLTKSIGVSNFSVKQLEDLLTYAKIKPVTNQCEAHPHFPNAEMAQFCKDHDMVFTAYSSLGTVWEGQESCLTDPVVVELAQKHQKSAAQVLLKWALQRGYLILPKSVSVKRVIENSQLYDFEISKEDILTLTNLGNGRSRKLKPDWATHFE